MFMTVRFGAIHAHTLVVNMIMAKRKEDFGRGEFYLTKCSKLFFICDKTQFPALHSASG